MWWESKKAKVKGLTPASARTRLTEARVSLSEAVLTKILSDKIPAEEALPQLFSNTAFALLCGAISAK